MVGVDRQDLIAHGTGLRAHFTGFVKGVCRLVFFKGPLIEPQLFTGFRNFDPDVDIVGTEVEDFFVDRESAAHVATLRVVFGNLPVVLHRVADQSSFRIQIGDLFVDIDPGGVHLDDFFIESDRFEFEPGVIEYVRRLEVGRDGISTVVRLHVEIAHRIVNVAVVGSGRQELAPFGNGLVDQALGRKALCALDHTSLAECT